MKNNPVGSVWSKWDLHVHTPNSIVHNYGASDDETWEAFISDLEKLPPAFKVLGINDYIFVEGYERILKAKVEDGRLPNIDLILPVVELRLNQFGGVVKKNKDGTHSKSDWSRVNLHVIFDQISPDLIRQQFLSAISPSYHLIPEAKGKWNGVISRESLSDLGRMIIESVPAGERAHFGSDLQEGFNNLCVSLTAVQSALDNHYFEGSYLLAVGKTEWSDMKWTDQSIAEKKNIINAVDLVFTASENPEAYAKAKKQLNNSEVLDKLFDCSDAHAFSTSENKDRIGHCYTWVKADPTFQGLKHSIAEFNQRIFVGDTPPKQLLVASNRTKYISSISIKKKPGYTTPESWFDVNVPLNTDLVAIIGNKGSGKSALADASALVGDTRNHDSFSFLNVDRFRDPRSKLAAQYTGILNWHDGTISEKSLNEDPPLSSVERVKYLPQSYLETLCNELSGQGSSTFDSELRKIIYTHVPEEERIGFLSLDELLEFKVSELESERQQLVTQLEKLNTEIVGIEKRLSPEFRETLERQLETKKNELLSLETAKPAPVDDPLESEAAKKETAVATAKLAELDKQLQEIRSEEEAAREKRASSLKEYSHLVKILQAIKNHQKNHAQFCLELNGMLAETSSTLTAKDVLNLSVNTEPLDSLSKQLKATSDEQEVILSSLLPGSLLKRREFLESQSASIKNQLGEKQRVFLIYKEQLSQWEQSKAALQGDKEKPHTIAWLEVELASLDKLPAKYDALKASRIEVARSLHVQIGKVIDEYRNLYQPVKSFVQAIPEMEMPLPLDFDVRIAEDGFQERFLERINRQARGSFAGVEESNLLVRTMLRETDLMNTEQVLDFATKIDEMLHFDKRDGAANSPQLVSDQLRKGHVPEEIYNFIFGMGYLKPQYSLTYDGQEINLLSPGERGLLLLVFYLLVDKSDIPLIIDQPEENLDNQTIFKILVTCIKTAKQRRQVIMVTHNPNLAVVCDAEQVIYAERDKTNKKFSYTTGSLESPEIRDHVVKILEGTKPAFVNRQQKYGL